jgi:4-methyl-5(b-hydroxyethyl)-thiazole monophosphate biosynthesis
MGLLDGVNATCYPGFEQMMRGARYTGSLCTVDGNITTGEGPAAAFPFAYALLEQLVSKEKADEVATGMRYVHLMNA